MSEPMPKSKPASVPEPAEDPWRTAFVEFKTRDEKMVKDYQEEIDTLLVVAGLFSAVLTAFLVESYQSLQEDYTKTSADLLRHISHQLTNSSFPAAPDSSQFQAQRLDVRVNVCWFVSLLLSLVVALFGIFLKQCMRTYMKWTDVTPDRDAVAIRQVRYRGLETWRLGAILTLLPTPLQLSVILFLSGLLLFLWNLDRVVANVMAVLLVVTFFLVATVTFLPAVFKSCLFRSPLSEILAVSFWRVAHYAEFGSMAVEVFIFSRSTYFSDLWRWGDLGNRWHYWCNITSWVQFDEGVIERYNRDNDHVGMHVAAMVHLCHTTQSQPLWSASITAIIAEYPADKFTSSHRIGYVYYNEVWWPLLSHISLLPQNDLEFEDASRHSHSPSYPRSPFSAFRRLSSSMKQRWVSYLLHSKTLVCQSDSTPVMVSYMICCLAGLESTTGGPCIQMFMEVLKARYTKMQASQLDGVAYCLNGHHSPVSHDVLLDSLSDIKFVESVKFICHRLSPMYTLRTPTPGHRRLLDVLVQLACQVAMATSKEPHERVPEDLQDLMHTLQHVDASDPLRQSSWIPKSRAPALIFIARHEPDLFPEPFARAIVHQLNPVQLWNIACGVDGLDIEGIDVARITTDDEDYMWDSLDARTPNATELFIAPHTFSRILDAYEEQVK